MAEAGRIEETECIEIARPNSPDNEAIHDMMVARLRVDEAARTDSNQYVSETSYVTVQRHTVNLLTLAVAHKWL